MATSIILPKIESNYNNEIKHNIFIPKMKYDSNQYFSYEKENYEINSEYGQNFEINKANKINFLFPSVPIEKIESIILKKNYSIDEGIEKLRSLTISDRIKANNNNEKLSELKNRIIINNNINRNLSQKILQNNNNYNSNNIIKTNEKINDDKNNFTKLLFVDDFAKELLKSKNEEKLKKILFHQLFLLDQKKRNDKNIEQIEKSLNTLENDNKDLLKCQNGVLRALNKKIYSKSIMDMKLRDLEDEIMKINARIEYYQMLGDYYKNVINSQK